MERRSSTLAQMAGAPRQSTLTSYMPTLRNRLAAAIMGDRPSGSFLGDLVEKTIGPTVGSPSGPTAIDFTPFGLPFMADEAGRKMARPGVKGKASGLFDMGLAMIPVPAAVGAVKSGAKTVARQGEKLATKTLADYVAGEAAKKGEQAASQGFKAYHGSPHKFDAFDLSKIGTGEGAQAYGHGLYFAGNEDVAKGYRDVLSGERYMTQNGELWSPDSLQHMNVRVAAGKSGTDLDVPLQKAYDLYKTAPPATKGLLEQDIRTLEALKASGGISAHNGHMYEVNINANPEHFLDWDAPFSAHPPEVRQSVIGAAKSLGNWRGDMLAADLSSGADTNLGGVYTRMKQAAGSDEAATQAFLSSGAPGIKYLDQGSRGAGEGTRNYVVFDPATIAILRRYGILGPVLGGGAVAASQYQPPQQAKKPTEY